jgi:hypothetical protein
MNMCFPEVSIIASHLIAKSLFPEPSSVSASMFFHFESDNDFAIHRLAPSHHVEYLVFRSRKCSDIVQNLPYDLTNF